MYGRREAVQSSQIEGTEASLVDLLEWEAEATPRPAALVLADVLEDVAREIQEHSARLLWLAEYLNDEDRRG